LPKRLLPQRRKGAKRYRVSKGFLCAFAPLREKHFCLPHYPQRKVFDTEHFSGKYIDRSATTSLHLRLFSDSLFGETLITSFLTAGILAGKGRLFNENS
jgi:hypothetical protein